MCLAPILGRFLGLSCVVACLSAALAAGEKRDPADGHWAFQPVRAVQPPDGAGRGAVHPVDAFLAERLRENRLTPLPAADRRALIRRASFDLTGLPPTPAQVEAFVHDTRPDAWSRVIDSLLASPRYGERWGRHWLDLARYSDTAGENSDYPIPEAYRYRDYVIDAFNADKPYDRFLQEQIAGDILAQREPPERYAENVIATGFLAQAKRFGTGELEDLHLIIEDNLETLGQVVMGLTLRCARCHDHKYDPTSMQDYYALYGIFESTAFPHPGGESAREPKHFVPVIPPDVLAAQDKAYLDQHAGRLKELEAELKRAKAAHDAAAKKDQDALKKKVQEVEARIAAIQDQRPSRTAPLAYAVKEGKPRDAKLQKTGNPRSLGDTIPRGVPVFLDRRTGSAVHPPAGASGRLELAQWLTSADHPLTARVMANRIWQHHFGQPLVATPSNFGLQCPPPSHPDLLDWLAREFMHRGWSLKSMHRLIMTSEAYQRASGRHAANDARDPDNRYLWRFDRRRLDAESLRDSLLFLGGNLDLARPGAHPFPPKGQWKFTAHHQFKAVYPSNHRSVYLMVQRLHPHPFLALFNGPDTSASTPQRDTATVPLQALFLGNSDFLEQQAAGFAGALSKVDAKERLRETYLRLYARPPSPSDQARATDFLQRYERALRDEGVADPAARNLAAWKALSRVLLASNEFIFTD
jgi:hypothetical protein